MRKQANSALSATAPEMMVCKKKVKIPTNAKLGTHGCGGGKNKLEEEFRIVFEANNEELGEAKEGLQPPVGIWPEGQCPANGPIAQNAEQRVEHILDDNVGAVLAADGTRIQEGKAALHHCKNEWKSKRQSH